MVCSWLSLCGGSLFIDNLPTRIHNSVCLHPMDCIDEKDNSQWQNHFSTIVIVVCKWRKNNSCGCERAHTTTQPNHCDGCVWTHLQGYLVQPMCASTCEATSTHRFHPLGWKSLMLQCQCILFGYPLLGAQVNTHSLVMKLWVFLLTFHTSTCVQFLYSSMPLKSPTPLPSLVESMLPNNCLNNLLIKPRCPI